MVPQRPLDHPAVAVDRLAARAGIPTPLVQVIDHAGPPGARTYPSTGGSHEAPLILVWGIDELPAAQVEALIAHELGHLAHRHPSLDALRLAAATLAVLAAATAVATGLVSAVTAMVVPPALLTALVCLEVTTRLSLRHAREADAVAVDLVGIDAVRQLLAATAHRRRHRVFADLFALDPSPGDRLAALDGAAPGLVADLGRTTAGDGEAPTRPAPTPSSTATPTPAPRSTPTPTPVPAPAPVRRSPSGRPPGLGRWSPQY